MDKKSLLNQYYTPTWAARLLVERQFPNLGEGDVVWEPTCGDGRFLLAIPDHVTAFGTEIDPEMAEAARINTGREVVTGDFRQIMLPKKPTIILGNPPYVSELIDDLLDRAYQETEYGSTTALLLPVYYLQTASKVVDLNRRFSLSQALLPRNLFDNMSKPLMWATFTKEQNTVTQGFFLHEELHGLAQVHKDMRKYLVGNQATAHCWRDVVDAALRVCGGKATLPQLYACVEGNRPTTNPWWREQVRKIARKHYICTGPAEYALKQCA